MKTYQITLPDDFAEFVDRVLAEKLWDDANLLFMYALAQVQDELAADANVDIDKLRKAIQIGIDQADRGELKELDLAATWARAQERLAKQQEASHAAGDANHPG